MSNTVSCKLGSPKPTVSWKKVSLLQKEIEQEPQPIVEGEEQPPAPEPLYETVEEISELGEHVIISNSKVHYSSLR